MKKLGLMLGAFSLLGFSVSFAYAQEEAGEELLVHGSPATLELSRGVPVNVILDEIPTGVVVGNPEIADVNLVGNKSIVIVPKKVGVTAIVVTNASGRLISRITVPVNDPNSVAIWQNGDRTSHWCTSQMCLSDDEVRRANRPPPSNSGTVIQINSSNQSSSSADADGQGGDATAGGSDASGGGQAGSGSPGQ